MKLFRNAGELYIPHNHRCYRVGLEQVLYIEAATKYCLIYLTEKKYTVRAGISELAGWLPEPEFFQVHRCYIVGRRHVQFFEPGSIQVGGKTLPFSESYYRAFLEQQQKVL